MIEFEWDPKKAETNLRQHGVGFQEAAGVFRDPLSITILDPDHSEGEDRYVTVGQSERGRALAVAHTDWGNRVRIISARELTRGEHEDYEEEIKRRTER